jgi:hypothetical protein
VTKTKKIQNCNIATLFTTGKVVHDNEWHEFIEKDRFYVKNCNSNTVTLVAVKSGKYILIDGDEDTYNETSNSIDKLQDGTNKCIITISFKCLKNAGMKDINKVNVIDSTADRQVSLYKNDDGFGIFEKTVPQGATYIENNERKSWHLAGSALIVYGKTTYICGMDEDSYFVSKLATSPKTIGSAFKSLKPYKVQAYEKRSGKIAKRQGEWFFIPCPDMEADEMKRDTPLPHESGGNEHEAEYYEEAGNGRHYCMGWISHPEHIGLNLKADLHEAICNTALKSWSVQGVD